MGKKITELTRSLSDTPPNLGRGKTVKIPMAVNSPLTFFALF